MEFKVGDRVKQGEKSAYLYPDPDEDMLPEDVGTVIGIKTGRPYPIEVEFQRINRWYVFSEDELERVDE